MRPERGRRALERVLPGLLVLLVAGILATREGGAAPKTWSIAGLFLLALLVLVLVVAPRTRAERTPLVSGALVAFAAFTAFSFASLLWADVPGAAWEGSNRTLLFGIGLALVVLRPWPPLPALVAFGVVAFGVGLVAVAVLIVTAVAEEPARYFLEGRLAEPIDYANATANLWLIGLFPALHLATVRGLAWPLRAAALGTASLLLQTALLSQSRGAAIGLIVATIVFVALSPRRWISLGAVVAVAVPAALAFDTLTAVHMAETEGGLSDALARAREAIALSAVATAVVGAIAALTGRWTPSELRTARARRAGDAAMAVLAGIAVVGALVVIGSPARWVDERWEDFKTAGYSQVDAGENRFGGSLGSNRYDFWRVALNEFADHPVGGIGTDNFALPYLLHRRSLEAPTHPHGLPWRLLSQNGLVGSALFAVFLVLMGLAVARARRALDDPGRALVAAGVAAFGVWFVHGLADWLWEFPALSLLALALLGICATAVAVPAPEAGEPVLAEPVADRVVGRQPGATPVPVLAAAALVIGLSFALQGTAARFTQAAYANVAVDPARTLDQLDRAATLDPLSAAPLIAEGVIARRLGDPRRARTALQEALEREPANWLIEFELALVLGESGAREAAARHAQVARELNPRQPVIQRLQADLGGGRRIDADTLEEALTEQLRSRLDPTGGS